MRKLFFAAVLAGLALLSGCGKQAALLAVQTTTSTAVFLSGMGCSDPQCTDPAHHHDCPAGCADYSHYHSCPLDCDAPEHHHEPAQRGFGARGGPAADQNTFLPGMGCTDPQCADPAHHHDCPAGCADYSHHHSCPLDCDNLSHCHGGFSSGSSGRHHGGSGHHGGHRR